MSRQLGRLQLKGVASVRMRSRGPRRSLQNPTRGRRHRQAVLPQTSSPPSPGLRVNLEATTLAGLAWKQMAGKGQMPADLMKQITVVFEPALPMALPPGMSPSDLGEQREPGDEEELDGELLPKPDPTWPRLFGSRAGAQAIAETDDVPSPPGQPAVPGRGTTGEQPVEASHKHASRERQGGLPEAQHGEDAQQAERCEGRARYTAQGGRATRRGRRPPLPVSGLRPARVAGGRSSAAAGTTPQGRSWPR